jgi:hypothetical protein
VGAEAERARVIELRTGFLLNTLEFCAPRSWADRFARSHFVLDSGQAWL